MEPSPKNYQINDNKIEENKLLIREYQKRFQNSISVSTNDEYCDLKGISSNINNLNETLQRKLSETQNFRRKWKTEICHYWEVDGVCKFGDKCAFAHGEKEIKSRKYSINYKTKSCNQFFENGYCPYGARCQFSHKIPVCCIEYSKLISDIYVSDTVKEKILKRPRLFTFENITNSDQKITEYRSQLYDDLVKAKKEMEKEKYDNNNSMEELNNNEKIDCNNINQRPKGHRSRFMSC